MVSISPKAFFFDFDGVICDTERAHMFATMDVVKNHGIHFTEEYYFENLFGFDDKGLFQHLFEKDGKDLSSELLDKLLIHKNFIFLDLIQKRMVHMEGVTDLIKRLEEKSIPLCVVSGSLKEEVEVCLKNSNLTQHFKFLICADMVEYSKPEPESYETAYIEMLKAFPDLKQEDCWALEDSPTGIESALGAGFKVIGITNTTVREKLSKADFVVDDYSEIKIES